MDWRALAPLFSAVFIGTSAAFLISNGSFYRLSGYFADMSWLEYGASVAPYYLPYMINTLVYIACTAGVHIIVTRLNSWQKNTGLRA